MAETATIDVAEVIERQPIGPFTIRLVLLSWLVIFFDGYDMTSISFTSKYLMKAFELDKTALGYVLSVGIFGLMLGGVCFGWLGDRIGRRPSVVLATFTFSLLTAATGFAQTHEQLLVLRFLDGVALGGAVPLLWALNIEYVPRRFRARVVTLILLGYGFGVAFAGPIARGLIGPLGWPGVFWFGGAASLISGVLLLAWLPESLRFMVSKGAAPARIAAMFRRMAPSVALPDGATFDLSDETARAAKQPFRPNVLFRGRLALITPLVWIAYIASSLSTYFLTTWGPLVLEDMGFGANGAAWVTFANSLCGAIGGLAIMGFTDRKGPISIAALPAIAVPLLLVAGLAPMGLNLFFPLSLCLSVFLGGSHYAIQSIVGLFYPSAYRANGAGWAGSVGKVGSVAAPIIGAMVLARVAPRTTYALLAACPAVLGICVVLIGLIDRGMRASGVTDASEPTGAADPVLAGE